MLRRMLLLSVAVFATGAVQAKPAAPADVNAIEAAAHDGYVAAINSNDHENFTCILTDDVVFQSPGESELVGKVAVRE